MFEFKIASAEIKEDLIKLYQECFHEDLIYINLFFEKQFKPENCFVAVHNGKVICAAHLLEALIIENDKQEDVYYIYAAGTSSSFRGQGLMSKLLKHVKELARRRSRKYLFLLPANDYLSSYYAKQGYIDFFYSKLIKFTRNELQEYANGGSDFKGKLNLEEMFKLRLKLLNENGNIVWNNSAIDYAISYNDLYRGETLFSKHGYAICSPRDNNTVEIIEIVVEHNDLKNLIKSIISRYKRDFYIFRLSASNNYFNKDGEIRRFGMIINTQEQSSFSFLKKGQYPYIGLTLD